MKKVEEPHVKKGPCSGQHGRSAWMLGGSVVFLAIILSVAMFKTRDSAWTGQNVASGAAQQAAFRPNCPTGFQPVAFNQGQGMMRCPRCNTAFNDPNCARRGFAQCPRCQNMISMRGQGGRGFANVALTRPGVAVPIFRDAAMLHEFRGVCENCHTVNPDIAIPANTTQVLHGYRGVCSNCHTITGL